MIYIYYSYLSEQIHTKLMEEDLPKFPISYQKKIKGFRKWEDAQLSLLGRILLFKGIEEIYKQNPFEKVIKHLKFNKPYFEENDVYFNISHSGEIVVCAFSDQAEVGIDIELLTEVDIKEFRSQMTENEYNNIMNSNDSKVFFYNYWTQKEAVLKADGSGLSVPLVSFEISDNTTTVNDTAYFLKEIKINNKYKCFVSQKAEMSYTEIKTIEYNFVN